MKTNPPAGPMLRGKRVGGWVGNIRREAAVSSARENAERRDPSLVDGQSLAQLDESPRQQPRDVHL